MLRYQNYCSIFIFFFSIIQFEIEYWKLDRNTQNLILLFIAPKSKFDFYPPNTKIKVQFCSDKLKFYFVLRYQNYCSIFIFYFSIFKFEIEYWKLNKNTQNLIFFLSHKNWNLIFAQKTPKNKIQNSSEKLKLYFVVWYTDRLTTNSGEIRTSQQIKLYYL